MKMNVLMIAIIFGLVFPIYNFIANALTGSLDPEQKEVFAEWVHDHPIASIFGVLLKLAIPVTYWVLVLVFLV